MEINSNNFLLSDFPPLPPTPTNPRKKRTRFLKLVADGGAAASKPKPVKKPNPSAPKITPPCTECGKTFWSWKALFGHMRCHPERGWRGINPPPSLRRDEFTAEEHQVAAALLMLANGPPASNAAEISYTDKDSAAAVGTPAGFECSSCKKVFGSRQALGGHSASHKNVKGCFANTKDEGAVEEEGCSSEMTMMMILNDAGCHKCSICFRVFSSGQALGGHMRCHWEKVEQPSRVCDLDLNLAAAAPPPPPPLQEDDGGGSSSSGLTLDLRLGF